MKVISLIVFTFLLISCATWPVTVTVDGTIYRTGFYREVSPTPSYYLTPRYDLTYIGDQYKVKGLDSLRRVNHEQFDLLYGYDGGPAWSGGIEILYINESQWKIAQSYYANSDNFVYYCDIFRENGKKQRKIATVTNIIPSKFDELMTFAGKIEYAEYTHYFGLNKRVETRRLEIFDLENTFEYVFYKNSCDGIFSTRAKRFRLFEGKLLFQFYDFYLIPVVVDISDELGRYFIELLVQFSS
jgi:hypothetical protein